MELETLVAMVGALWGAWGELQKRRARRVLERKRDMEARTVRELEAISAAAAEDWREASLRARESWEREQAR